jgi:hypothetical protein
VICAVFNAQRSSAKTDDPNCSSPMRTVGPAHVRRFSNGVRQVDRDRDRDREDYVNAWA